MKKIVCLIAVALIGFSFTAEAQIQRGNLLVGGDIANLSLDLNKGGYFNATLNPKFAIFIRNNVALGPYLNLSISSVKGSGTGVGYGIGGFGRYYINDSSISLLRHGRFFLEANVGIEGNNPAGSADNTNGLGLGVGPGYTYFLTPNVGLEALLKYNGIVGFGSSSTSSNLALSFGFQIYLSSRRMSQQLNDIIK